jgi:Flp pilus assembly pilin Flp
MATLLARVCQRGRTKASTLLALSKEDGQDLVEYAVMLVLIALALIGSMKPLSRQVSSVFKKTQEDLQKSAEFEKIMKGLDSLPRGQIAYNVQDTMEVDKQYTFDLRLSQQKSMQELQQELQSRLEGQRIETHQVTIAPLMEAALNGDTFSVWPPQPYTQPVDPRMTEWQWEVVPRRGGERQLHLRLSVIVNLDGKDYPHAIQTFESTIEVHVTPWRRVKDFEKDHWEWSCAAVLGIAGWVRHRKKKKPRPWEVP